MTLPGTTSSPKVAFGRRTFLRRSSHLTAGFVTTALLVACAGTPSSTPTVPPVSATPTGAPSPTTAAIPTLAAPTPTAPAIIAPTQTPPSKGTPRRGGTLVAAVDQDPGGLDPHKGSSPAGFLAYDLVYESLTAWDEHLNVVPSLATTWDISTDRLSYVFHLRPNVSFHDGRALVADDVKYSLERVVDASTGAPFRSWLGPVTGVTVVDPRTVKLTLDAPYPGLLGGLASLRASAILPAGVAEKVDLQTSAIGTGPFRLTEYVAGGHLTYLRHAGHWSGEFPYLDGISARIVPDELARATGVTSGTYHFAPLGLNGVARLAGSPEVDVIRGALALVNLTYVNVAQPPLDDARVRRALRLAVDDARLIEQEAKGAGVRSGPIPSGFSTWAIAPADLPYPRADIVGAKKLLSDAGFPEGRAINLGVKVTSAIPTTISRANVMRDAFKDIGVTLTIEQLDLTAWITAYQKNDFELFNSGNAIHPDPDDYFSPFFASSGSLNAGGYSNPKVDDLIARARVLTDPAARAPLYHDLQRRLLDDCPNYWWYSPVNLEALSRKVGGFVPSPTGSRRFLHRAWLEA